MRLTHGEKQEEYLFWDNKKNLVLKVRANHVSYNKNFTLYQFSNGKEKVTVKLGLKSSNERLILMHDSQTILAYVGESGENNAQFCVYNPLPKMIETPSTAEIAAHGWQFTNYLGTAYNNHSKQAEYHRKAPSEAAAFAVACGVAISGACIDDTGPVQISWHEEQMTPLYQACAVTTKSR